MKIDRSKSKKSSSDVPFDCKLLIEELKLCDEDKLLSVLKRIKTWNCGKCELYHWIDVLDIFDSILEECCRKETPDQWELPVDMPQNAKKRELLLAVISFTSLLIEHSFSRHLYNSIEHLITLLSSTDMQIVLAILNLLFVFSKRSNFFSRISTDKRQSLLARLNYLAQNWGGKEQGFGLAQCCQDLPLSSYPSNATVFNFEFYSSNENSSSVATTDEVESKSKGKDNAKKTKIVRINLENVHLIDKPVSQIMKEIAKTYNIPSEQQMQIFTQLRLTKNFANYHTRLQCVQARLNALSIMVYCQAMALHDNYYQLLYNGLIEELVEVLELKNPDLIEMKSASLKTLTSIIHLDRNSKHKVIIESTGANSYHGFLPILVRNCINSLISGNMKEYPLNFVTALFSFLYHLASCETGCEALVQCGIMESLLRVVDWKGPEADHLTFVTRAVRVIDLLTNQFIDMNAFQSNNGLNTFVQRLEHEVNICRAEQPYEIEVPADKINKEKNSLLDEDFDTETPSSSTAKKDDLSETPMEVELEAEAQQRSQSAISKPSTSNSGNNNLQCYPQRAALMKSMLNFLKKAVQCNGFFESVRPLMYGNFPRSLRHIISNAEYYGPSLFLLATDVVSVYVYQEPSLLSVIQDNGLTDVVLHALLVKNVPPTKEVLASLPTVFTSLCLNHRGLEAFVALHPFERLFKVFLQPDYLQAMRRRRSESIGDTATCLGNSMDELMRHQPSLRIDAIGAIIKLLEEICNLGSDPKYICIKASSKSSSEPTPSLRALMETSNRNISASNVNNDSSSSEEDDDFDDDTTTTAETTNNNQALIIPSTSDDSNVSMKFSNRSEQNRQQIPLIDYILNVMRFVDAILSNNSTPDHCREFLNQNGLEPLFKMLKLPNLPLDFPAMPACYSIAGVFKSLLNLAHEKNIFTKGLEKLKEILDKLDPLSQTAKTFNGSILLEDLINHISSKKSPNAVNFVTPVLQSMAAAHSYIIMFIHICRTGQGDIRSISIDQWGSPLGVEIINLLGSLYIALVWESTLLLGLNDSNSQKYEFVKSQIEKLNSLLKNNSDIDNAMSPMEVDFEDAICINCSNRLDLTDKKSKSAANNAKNPHQKYTKPLLTVASRLGRALAELFGLLVKLCVGSPIRRRSHHSQPLMHLGISQQSIHSKPSQNIAKQLNILLQNALSWQPSFDTNIPKFRLTFNVCSIGFSSPMLFDDLKYPYHIMLRYFVLEGGQDAFFDCFKMAFDQTLTNDQLPDGLVEFLDSWLLLLEKMTNPQTLFDSPYTFAAPKTNDLSQEEVTFDPVQYLIRTHKKAFPCIMKLWNSKLYKIKCNRAIESLVTIFSHILKGETIIEKHMTSKKTLKNVGANANNPGTSGASSSELGNEQAVTSGNSTGGVSSNWMAPSENNLMVQSLIEMGFPRDAAVDAIVHVGINDLFVATDWILQRHHRYFAVDNEDEEMIRAIALSLSDSSRDVENFLKSIEDKTKEKAANAEPKEKEKLVNEIPMRKEDLDTFTNNIYPCILKLIDLLPTVVHKCCELLISISKRNGKKWFEDMLMQLIEDIIANANALNNKTSFVGSVFPSDPSSSIDDWHNQLLTLPESLKLNSRIHLLVLLFNEAKSICAKSINNSMLLDNLLELLENASHILNTAFEKGASISTPKWVALTILLVDLYEKNALAARRRKRFLLDSMHAKRTWKYFDERSGRWSWYTLETSKTIDEAFRSGETFCRIQVNRRKYTVNFINMSQVNDETNSCRPVMVFVDYEKNEKDDSNKKTHKVEKEKNEKSGGDTAAVTKEKDEKSKKPKEKKDKDAGQKLIEEEIINDLVEVDFLNSKQVKTIIESAVNLMRLPIDSEASDAIMRLFLRLTRNHENACLFVQKQGISALLKISRTSSFKGYVNLTTLIIRHVLEDEKTLKITMDKIIRIQNSVTTSIRDMHYWFRYFTPAVCRDVELFKNSAMNAWRINVPYPVNSNRRLNQDEDRASVTLRVINNKSAEQEVPVPYEVPKLTKDVICELLNMLPVKFAQHIAQKESEEANKTEDNKDSNKENDVFYTHTILSILAELTKSYHVVAKVICEHTYSIGYSESIVEDCSALSFILDNLLSYSVKAYGDKDCANYSKALFVAIASVPFVNEVHQTLVVEIKNSLNRAVLLPESVEKHAKIQALSTLITNIVETQTPWFQHNQILRQPQFSTNLSPVVKMFVRKNVVTDLAKVIQFLDLSTPLMTATVNSLLKTLEFLSKTLNTPCPYSRPQPSNVIRLPNRPRLMLEGSFPVPIIDLDPSPVPERETMEQDQHSENMNTNDANNEDSSQNDPTASQIPNASNGETAINTLNDSNVDDNIENELIFDSSAYDYNSHPRSGTFTSDELRTDEDDDEDQNAMVDVVSDRNEIHDNTINSNCAESTSSEGTESEASEDDSDDVELEEEEEEEDDEEDDDEEGDDEEGDDGAGSTQDEQEEDDEEDEDDEEHLDDEEFENEDYAIQAILDESSAFRYQTDNNELIFNLEEVLPHVLQVDPRMPSSAYVFPLGHTEDPSFGVSNGHNNHLSSNSMIPLHHPLLSRSAENVTASSSVNNGSSANTNSLNNTHLLTSHRAARNPRRALRSYLQTNNNWHIAHFNSRNNPSHILQRLLGSTSPNDLLHSGLRSQNGFSRQELEFRDEFFDLAPLTYTSNSSFQNCSYNSQPSTTSRWIEVSRILDGEYMFDAMLIIKPEIVKHLEKLKEEELREKKKKEEMEVSSETKKASSDNTVAAPNSAALNDDIQAHIEQLTNSVINQVLESNPTHQSGNNDEESIQPSAISIVSAENLDNGVSVENDPLPPVQIDNPEVDSSRMDIVSEEPAPVEDEEEVVPMFVNDGPAAVIFSNADAYSVELMDHSNQESGQVQSEEPQPVTINNVEQEQSAASEQQWQLTPPTYRMTPEERAILGDQELPEGVDPSFLAALPENIRQEVIAEQFRLQRLNYLRTQPPASSTPNVNSAEGSSAANNSNATFAEVNPEFLAALPPNIQEEVLAQQRAEQQRLNATNANPETPVDPDSFFRSLPPSLRRQVLSDLDDSQVQILPPEFANEARALRREYDIRHRQIHDRLFPSSNALSRIIRSATSARSRYEALGISNWTLARFSFRNGQEGSRFDAGFSRPSRSSSVRSIKGKHLLDYEGLSSILILLFMHDNLISSVRLQRLIKNLCFHPATRQWVIQSLLEIIEKTKECTDHNLFASMDDQIFKSLTQNNFVSWLSITLDSSFGSRTNVFYVGKSNPPSSSSKKSNSSIYTISINPQAAQFVCRNALDILILLAKTFPDQFISHPIVLGLQKNPSSSSLNNSSSSVKESPQQPATEQSTVTAPPPAAAVASSKVGPSFFEVLMRHDSIHATKKAKSKSPSSSSLAPTFEVNNNSKLHDYTPLSQLLNLLSHPFIKKSPLLTDRLVRLMTHITSALAPESDNRNRTPFPTQILNEIKGRLSEIEKTIAHERLLGLVVDVLSSKTCSEEGLIDSTSLLIKISNLFPKCRSIFYKLLIECARKISEDVHTDINALLIEMRDLFVLEKENPSHENEHHEKNVKGQTNVQDRYSSTPIIIKAQGNVKHNISGKEVQLPSMSNLISKTSSQFLFLRILKIIMLLREINAKCQKLQKQKENSTETKMEVDHEDKLSSELQLDHLWGKLSDCLSLLSEAPDDHVVLVLQPAVESFFLVHAPEKSKSGTRSENTAAQQTSENQAAAAADSLTIDSQNDGDNRHYQSLPADTQKFLIFAEKHRVVLNQILRQSSVHLANGPFAVLVDHTRILDFDVKRRYFRQELERNDQGTRREDLPVHIRREHVFEDSYRELNRRTPDDWKNRFYIVFEGEEGQDAGGLLREWYTIISREIFNPNYALFTTSPGDRVTYMINSASHCNSNHLSYFRFVGRVISKAIHDNKLLDCYFTRSFYKHILDKTVKYTDMESEDYAFYQGLVFLLEHNVNELGTDLAFSLEVQEFGVTEVRDLVPDGRNKMVTEENKHEYVKLVCQEKMTGSIKKQLNSFLEGFYEIIPKHLISIFNEHELELLISGLPNIDIDDLKANTDYHKYQASSLQIQWFWRALRSFDQADRANFLQFVTGTSKVPLQGFSALEGMNGPQKFQIHMDDRSTDRLPSAHTCFNQLDLPAYETYDKLRLMLLKAIHECSEGFGFA